ncbi:MAG: nuclear transport factor 2 family protein [Pseudomonadales bacterium]|nr:nuclear transport factor 2 family protein [Pseudomonadales bacterium]
MKKLLPVLMFVFSPFAIAQGSDELAVAAVLDQYHQAAAAGDWEVYFDLMSEDGVFLGTDAGERWPKEVFREYAGNRSGWLYTPRERNINFTPDGNTAWFDEILDSASYGTSRGTGVLIRTAAGWKISQYHLTFPIPNALAREVTDQIKALENQ